MRGATLILGLALLVGCGSGDEPGSATTSTDAGAKSPAVTGVTITEEKFDRDEDGQVETSRTRNPDGSLTIQIDTDGDGKPDLTRTVDALQAPPEGFDPEQKLELNEVEPEKAKDDDVPELR